MNEQSDGCDLDGQIIEAAVIKAISKFGKKEFARMLVNSSQVTLSDSECTQIYEQANNLQPNQLASITTKRVFTAMRAVHNMQVIVHAMRD